MEWWLKCIRQYADFNGRARRKEYWMFSLFNLLFGVPACVLDNVFGLDFANLFYGPFYLLYGLFVFIPNLAVSVRRLHDIGKSGWMYLVGLIPIVGGIWLIILFVRDSQIGENQYGPNPKGIQ